MTTLQKVFLTIGIFVQAILTVDLYGTHTVQEHYMIRRKAEEYSHEEVKERFHVQSPLRLLTQARTWYPGLKDDIREQYYWFSGINVGVTLLMLAIWRRKKTADA